MKGINPLIPMGAITGRPDRARMEQVLKAYKAVGIEQFLIYPRSGLEYEYMSPEWMRLVRDTVEIAASLDMKIWLYDEYNWPSGNCRGQVTAGHDEFYPNALVFEKDDGTWHGSVVRNRLGADILNPDAVARFLLLTHQRYYDTLSDYFGTVIQGIFTDEPSFGYFAKNSDGTLTKAADDSTFMLAWYDGLEEAYRAACGHDMRTDAIGYLEGDRRAFSWETYYRLMGDRMRTVFVGGMNRWCEEHGIVLTGHLLCEDAPSSVQYNGNPLKMLSEFSQPGMDEINTRVSFSNGRMELSAMALVQYAGRNRAHELAELFALGPTEMDMATMRQMIWMTACYGVDRYVLAVAALDPKGNVEKDSYYFPTGPCQPWFEYYGVLGETARLAAETARKPFHPSVRLRYPAGLFMRVFRMSEGRAVAELYHALEEELVKGQVQFLYIDEDEETNLPVMTMDENGLFIEGEKSRYDNAEAFAEHVNALCPRRCVVRDAAGREPRDVLTRVWADDTVTLVDLTCNDANDRLLTVEMDGQMSVVRLTGHGVFSGRLNGGKEIIPLAIGEAETGEIRLSLEQSNLRRYVYTQSSAHCVIRAAEPIEGLRLHVRRDPAPLDVLLDGCPIEASEADDRLPDGFSPLYRATKPFVLNKGEHVIEIVNAAQAADHRFLPGLLLSGSFEEDSDGALRPFSGKGALGEMTSVREYAGSFELTMTVDVPDEEGLVLSLDTRGACTRAALDGEPLGERCWAPFEWRVPEKYKGGRHELTVRITTSIMPMMGDIAQLEAEQPYAGWVSIRSGEKAHPGLMKKPVWKKGFFTET